MFTKNKLQDITESFGLHRKQFNRFNNITLRKVNVKPCGFDKMYLDEELIEVLSNNRSIQQKKSSKILFNTFKQNTNFL